MVMVSSVGVPLVVSTVPSPLISVPFLMTPPLPSVVSPPVPNTPALPMSSVPPLRSSEPVRVTMLPADRTNGFQLPILDTPFRSSLAPLPISIFPELVKA